MDKYEIRAAEIIQKAKSGEYAYVDDHPVYWNIESFGEDYGIGCFFDEQEKVWKLYENYERGSHYIFMVTDDESAAVERLSRRICAELEGVDRRERMKNKKAVRFLNNKKKFMELTEVYGETRSQALSLKSADIGLPDLGDDVVYAAVVDISHEDGTTATLVCTIRGDVEFYHSSGEVYQKLDRDENVKKAALIFLVNAKDKAKRLKKVKDFPLPQKGITTAYFLSNGEITKVDMKNGEKPERKNWFIDALIKVVLINVKDMDSRNLQRRSHQ